MNSVRPRSWSRWKKLLALGTIALSTGRLCADDPAPVKGPQTPQTPPRVAPATPPQTPTAQQTQEPNLDPGQFGGDTGGQTAALGAANMMGDLLYGTRSISFFYSRGPAGISPINVGSTTVVNSTIAENNSPIPQDRAYFRFNYFNNSQSVTGLADTPNSAFLPSASRSFDAEFYTFGFEKTFLCDRASVELRVPFATSLGSKQNLIPGVISGPGTGAPDLNGNPPLATQTIPGGSLGTDATEFGNISLIFKGLAYKSEQWAFGGGLGVDLPTAPDTSYRIVDFGAATPVGSTVNSERLRTLDIGNDTVNLAPFVTALWTPSDKFFLQGFSQLDVPVGTSGIRYHVEKTGIFGPGAGPNSLTQAIAAGQSALPPFNQSASITDQTLLHVDLGMGYWFRRDPCDLITAIAPTLELHYTTTLCNAQIVQLKGDGSSLINNPAISNIATRLSSPEVPEPGPQVGNLANRLDLLDLTVGWTMLIGDRITVANGFAFPLRNADNRTFDWEYQLQINYYFGGPKGGRLRAPNF